MIGQPNLSKVLSKTKLLITLFSPSLPVHEKRMPRANPLQERLLLTMTHFCSTLPKFGKSSTLGRAYWTKGTWGGDGDFNMRANLFYWDNALSIPFYRAGVYWIYILSIHPGCLRGDFQYTPALEKRMAIHCLELGWIGKYAPLGKLPQGAYFPIHPFSRQCIITILWVKKYRNLRLTGTISHFTQLIAERELAQADQKFTAASVLCRLCTQIGSSVSSDPVIHNLDHAVDIELCTCVVFGVYARQQRRGNLNASQYNEKITLITLISFRFNEIYTLKQSGVKNWNLEILTSRRLMFEIKTKLLNL